MAAPKSFDHQLDELLAECYADPLKYVLSMFPWDTDTSIQLVKLPAVYKSRFPNAEYGPDLWACQFLDALGADIKDRAFDGRHAVEPIQCAVKSGHGIGKSVMVAWLVKFLTDTRPFCKGTVTANTAPQLRTKTWAEVGKWHKLSLSSHRFHYRSGQQMELRHKEAPEKWYCTAQTCKEENSESFAGQHAADSTSFYIFDEASAIPSKIYQVRGGGLTDGEPMTFDFGNPTRNSGEFYEECEGNMSHRVRSVSIDSRTVAITSKAYIERLIKDYGEDSDYVKVRVKGEFPGQGSVQFIPTGDVVEAMSRTLSPNRTAPLVLGIDVARFGDDDSVIFARVGDDARSWEPRRFKGLDTVQFVGKITACINEFKSLGMPCAGLFVDGGGVGAGVVDQLRHLGYNPIEVQFGAKATDAGMYRRKGDEIWGKMRDHIHTRLCLPGRDDRNSDDIRTQLTGREYGFTDGGQIHLEQKKDMKDRGLGSPDIADALALTYAQDVAPLSVDRGHAAAPMFCNHDYDPMERY